MDIDAPLARSYRTRERQISGDTAIRWSGLDGPIAL
jgi:hypothetical protein